jgi:DNA-binding transcriptional MerR regulator
MAKTLEEIEKQLEAQAAQIKDALAKNLPPEKIDELKEHLANLQKKVDDFLGQHDEAEHHCFWCG